VPRQCWAIALLLACHCRSSGVQLVDGVPALTAAPPVMLSGGPGAYTVDFGVVAIGQETSAPLTLANVGSAALAVTQTGPSTDGPFTLSIGGSVLIPAGGKVTLIAYYKPAEVGARRFVVQLQTDSPKIPLLTVTLSGDGEKALLAVAPPFVDFGNVVVHTSASLPIRLTNDSAFELTVTPSAMQGPAAALFSLVDAGAFALGAGETAQLTATYAPVVPSSADSAQFTLAPNVGLPITMNLQGVALQRGLLITPANLDFSFVAPQQTPTSTVRIANIGNVEITLFSVGLEGNGQGSRAFTVPAGLPSGAASTKKLASGEELDVPVTFSPLDLGFYSSNLRVTVAYDVGDVPIDVPIQGYGGGASIACLPVALDFGVVGAGVSTTLPLLCTNTGVDVPGYPVAGLQILGAPTSSSLFSADFSASAQPLAAGQTIQIDVNYLPLGAASDMGTLTVLSNVQNGSPAPVIQLSGSAVSAGPCNFALTPVALDWGVVQLNTPETLGFTVTDLGPNDCIVWDFGLAAGTSTAFSLANPGMGSQRLSPPGGPNPTSLTVPIVFDAVTKNVGPYSGEATFQISNPAAPNQFVPLKGLAQTSCLTLQPTSLEFGTVDSCDGGPCTTWPRSVVAQNGCAFDAHLTAISAQAPFAPYDLPALPLRIAAGDSSPPLSFSFAPTTFGDFYGAASFATDLQPSSMSLFLHGMARNLVALTPVYTSNLYELLASGDLNGDGMLDLVAGIYPPEGDGGTDILLGLLDGGLGPPTRLSASSGWAAALGDLNGDGLPDIVASNGLGVNVFFQQSDGGYSPPIAYAAVGDVRSIGLGDINGDGFLDMAMTEYVDPNVGSSAVEVRFNTGAGIFGPSTSLPLGPEQGNPWGGLVVVDLNQDGLADIAVGMWQWVGPAVNAPGLEVFLSEGDGGFAVSSFPASSVWSVSILPAASGPPNLVLSLAVGAGIQILTNSGAGTFSGGDFYPTPAPCFPIILGDFNGDGTTDLAASCWENAYDRQVFIDGGTFIWLGTSSGSFESAETPPVLEGTFSWGNIAPLGPVGQPHGLAVTVFDYDYTTNGGIGVGDGGGMVIYGDSSRH
jgi:hypothetical protein